VAFLLLLAKIIGREVTRKRSVDSSAFTTAVRVLPAVMKPLSPTGTGGGNLGDVTLG
jgi:hypothetical protein